MHTSKILQAFRKTARFSTGKSRTYRQENRAPFDDEHSLRVVKIRAFERALRVMRAYRLRLEFRSH